MEEGKSNNNLMCECGSQSEEIVGTVTHHVLDRKIQIHNVPHEYCSRCKSVSYDSELDLMPVLDYAYDNGLEDVDYLKFGV